MKTNEDGLAVGTKVAPTVGLLLFGEGALASDMPDDEDIVSVPEPSTLALSSYQLRNGL
jgi:hypothetical protein